MTTYKGIQGFTIQNLSADPSNPIEGQVWYNSTSNVWKVEEATTVGAWASGGNLATARNQLGGAGTQTAALAISGNSPGPTYVTATEEYDGQVGQLVEVSVTARLANLAGAGTQTAALAFGGYDTAATGATEEYNGTSWSPGGSLNTARQLLTGAGTQTAALALVDMMALIYRCNRRI
jgi:hypothetical protein